MAGGWGALSLRKNRCIRPACIACFTGEGHSSYALAGTQNNHDIPRKAIENFCRKWKIVELSLFGSVLREDFRPDSDVGVLVTFESAVPWSLLMEMEEKLKEILRRDLTLVEKEGLRNPFRYHSILTTREVIYAP